MKQASWSARSQRGGTLVGFVVGLLVGLGIALSVAVYVTRVPVPFVDRGVSRKPAQDLEEAERNKGWNPNAQLAGKPAPLPAPATPEGTATAGAISVPPADGQPLPPVPTKPAATATATAAVTRPAAGPLGDLVASKLGGTATASTPAANPSGPACTSSLKTASRASCASADSALTASMCVKVPGVPSISSNLVWPPGRNSHLPRHGQPLWVRSKPTMCFHSW